MNKLEAYPEIEDIRIDVIHDRSLITKPTTAGERQRDTYAIVPGNFHEVLRCTGIRHFAHGYKVESPLA